MSASWAFSHQRGPVLANNSGEETGAGALRGDRDERVDSAPLLLRSDLELVRAGDRGHGPGAPVAAEPPRGRPHRDDPPELGPRRLTRPRAPRSVSCCLPRGAIAPTRRG